MASAVPARHDDAELVEQRRRPQRAHGDVAAPGRSLGLPGVEPADPGAEGDLVEDALDLHRGVRDPPRSCSGAGAVRLDLVVRRRCIGAIDDEHRLAVEIAGGDLCGAASGWAGGTAT